MGTLITVCVTAWAVLLGLGVFGLIGTHAAQTAGTVLGVATFVGAGLTALARQF